MRTVKDVQVAPAATEVVGEVPKLSFEALAALTVMLSLVLLVSPVDEAVTVIVAAVV